VVNRRGFNCIHVGALPPQLAALNNLSVAVEEMAVDAALTGDAATQGDAATAPLTLTLIITLPGADPAVPPMPVTATCALTLPLVRESAAWRVDQTIFFRQLRDALAAQLPGTALPAWDF